MRVIIREAGVDYRIASDIKVSTPEDAALAAKECNGDTEVFCVLYLDSKNGLRSAEIVSSGVVDASLVHPREVFRTAIKRMASSVVLVHNHPSGDPSPSAEDLRITKQLVEAGKIIDIKVLDHIILGNGRHFSMREEGVVVFT